MSALTARFLLLGGALLLFVGAALGEGTYQTTKDGKTTVWNDRPKAGDIATWEGDRDREGYATGFGTLTWYTDRQSKSTIYARYFGNMVKGKFEGPVNAHSKGKTAHAIFSGGTRTSAWATGPAPTRSVAGKRVEPAQPEAAAAVEKAATIKPRKTARADRPKPETAAVTPMPTPPIVARKREEPVRAKTPAEPPAATPVPSPSPVAKRAPKPAGTAKAMREADESVRSLAGPPSSLRTYPASENPAANPLDPNPPLSKEEVTDLADTLARARGYNPAEYERPEPHYNSANDAWSLSYDQKPSDGAAETSKHFNVTVDGKTKRASIGSDK